MESLGDQKEFWTLVDHSMEIRVPYGGSHTDLLDQNKSDRDQRTESYERLGRSNEDPLVKRLREQRGGCENALENFVMERSLWRTQLLEYLQKTLSDIRSRPYLA